MTQVYLHITVRSNCSYKNGINFFVFQLELLVHTGISGIIHLSSVVSLWIVDTLLPILYLIAEVKRRKRQSSGILQYIFSRRTVSCA